MKRKELTSLIKEMNEEMQLLMKRKELASLIKQLNEEMQLFKNPEYQFYLVNNPELIARINAAISKAQAMLKMK